jgi:alpha-glucosidase
MEREWLWWKHGVIYQIYPRSFYDSNGDGIGDIEGIVEKLDYLSDLGIDGIWLSPINRSPMYDFGYDISDYREIDPVFGTAGDFNRLIGEAHKRGIHVIMDLVFNHTSHLHPWFIESRSSRDNTKRDWYIWRDDKKGRPPNNWMAAFGGRAWEWDEKTGQYYLHSFLKEQPDLNWRNDELKGAVFNEIRYWLDRGIDGFRLDVINFFVKDGEFRSNPFGIGPYPRPYDLQKHIYDRNRPELHDLLRELRELLDSYDSRMLVGEVYSPPPGDPPLSASCLGNGEDELHLAFDFSLLYLKWHAQLFSSCIEEWNSVIPERGWPCHVLSNHDQPRSFSRYGLDKDALKRARVLAAMLLTLRGTPFIYYGEEIGMRNGKLKRGDIVDPVGKKYWPFNKGRDPERTPMQWSSGVNAGFSSGRPWLPVNSDFNEINVEVELGDPNSLLNYYKGLLSLRRERVSLQRGDWIPINAHPHILAYYRIYGDEKLLVALNLARSKRFFSARDDDIWQVIFSTHRTVGESQRGLASELQPYEASILERVR